MVDESKRAATKRLRQLGRGERCVVRATTRARHQVWGKDSDDDYQEGE